MNSENTIIQIIKSITNDYVKITDPAQSLREVGIDSLIVIDVIIAIEDEFEVRFDSASLDPSTFVTVQHLIHLVQHQLAKEETIKSL